MGGGVDANIKVEYGTGSDPGTEGEGEGAARGDVAGEPRYSEGLGVGVGVYESVGVDGGGFEVGGALLEVKNVAFELEDEVRIHDSGKDHLEGDILDSVHVELHGGEGRKSLGVEYGKSGSVADRLVGNEQLSDLERSDGVVGQRVEG